MSNKYNKPWKVDYEIDFETEKPRLDEDGKKIIMGIIDCDDKNIIQTDCGYYPPDAETAEYIVKCVNERKDD